MTMMILLSRRMRRIRGREKLRPMMIATMIQSPRRHRPPASTSLRMRAAKSRRIAHEFLHLDEQPKNAFERFVEMVAELIDFESTPPPVWAMRIDTGVGKTRIVVEEIVSRGRR